MAGSDLQSLEGIERSKYRIRAPQEKMTLLPCSCCHTGPYTVTYNRPASLLAVMQ